ncbi:hypothetical protein [Hymenobacter sp. GOD-10R]|uniref:hypothetical protein n=1 Tax=Hymenobacter sp. GOD-10R TaxID=3093922 RepID=UPI002D765836|nr:hypothetical protein [Hymenobacter sp. GOD-10R]WRQ29527.1 hypothetical protein SD425_04540 [Hymenobacter sp. GOD-10R]
MKVYLLCLLVFLLKHGSSCVGQRIPEKLVYQLAESVLDDYRQQLLHYLQKQAKSQVHVEHKPRVANDSIAATMLVLDHIYPGYDSYRTLKIENRSYEFIRTSLLNYLSLADLAYMRQQLPDAMKFKFDQTKLHSKGVKIIAFDTLTALRKRVSKHIELPVADFIEYRVRDTLVKQYGSRDLYKISCPLLSENHKQAVINIGLPGGREELCIYSRKGKVWRKLEAILIAYHD